MLVNKPLRAAARTGDLGLSAILLRAVTPSFSRFLFDRPCGTAGRFCGRLSSLSDSRTRRMVGVPAVLSSSSEGMDGRLGYTTSEELSSAGSEVNLAGDGVSCAISKQDFVDGLNSTRFLGDGVGGGSNDALGAPERSMSGLKPVGGATCVPAASFSGSVENRGRCGLRIDFSGLVLETVFLTLSD